MPAFPLRCTRLGHGSAVQVRINLKKKKKKVTLPSAPARGASELPLGGLLAAGRLLQSMDDVVEVGSLLLP